MFHQQDSRRWTGWGGVLTRRPPASSQSLGVLYGEPLKRRLSHSQPVLQRHTSVARLPVPVAGCHLNSVLSQHSQEPRPAKGP